MTPFPALVTPFPKIPKIPFLFTKEEATGATSEAAKAPRNPPSYFFISCFTVSVTPSINTSKFSSDFMILIILSMQTNKMNKVNLFPALTAPTPVPLARIFFFFFTIIYNR